jgi:putative toxin-antitoxin system antitoxin component (TIGR02293 family)
VIELKPYQPVVREAPNYWGQVGIPALGAELIQQVRRGFDYAVLERLAAVSGFPSQTLAVMAGLSAYAVRQGRRRGQWSSLQSDRLFRVARVLNATLDLFGGDSALARHWLVSPQHGLGGERPVAWLRTEVEAKAVLDLVGRIGAGVVT